MDTLTAAGYGRATVTINGIKYTNVYAEISFTFTDGPDPWTVKPASQACGTLPIM